MNLQEFAALKTGDKIRNDMTHTDGEVSEVTKAGVKIKWGGNPLEFAFPANSQAWSHWSKTETKTCPNGDTCINRERCTTHDQCLGGTVAA